MVNSESILIRLILNNIRKIGPKDIKYAAIKYIINVPGLNPIEG